MKKRTSEFRLTVSHYKIMETISELNKVNKYPTAKGVNNILSGKLDSETRQYIDLATFGTLISFPGRKLCSYILNMVRRGYLGYIYDEKSDDLYLRITEKGEDTLFLYIRKHNYSHKRKSPRRRAEIVEIK